MADKNGKMIELRGDFATTESGNERRMADNETAEEKAEAAESKGRGSLVPNDLERRKSKISIREMDANLDDEDNNDDERRAEDGTMATTTTAATDNTAATATTAATDTTTRATGTSSITTPFTATTVQKGRDDDDDDNDDDDEGDSVGKVSVSVVDNDVSSTEVEPEDQAEPPSADEYACDRDMARALAHLTAAGDRASADAWLSKLDECTDAPVRSQYLDYLLTALAAGNLRIAPFDEAPPEGPLKPLNEVVDPILLPPPPQVDPPDETTASAIPAQPLRSVAVDRDAFYGRQPIPEDGAFCYVVAFSDF